MLYNKIVHVKNKAINFIAYNAGNNNYEIGSGALPGKILLVRIIEDNKIDAYFRAS